MLDNLKTGSECVSPVLQTPVHQTAPASVRSKDNLLAILDCTRSSVRVRVYEKGMMKGFSSEGLLSFYLHFSITSHLLLPPTEEHLLQVLALAIDKSEKHALVKLLHNPLFGGLKVLTSEEACDLYFDSLKQLRGEEQMPENVLVSLCAESAVVGEGIFPHSVLVVSHLVCLQWVVTHRV